MRLGEIVAHRGSDVQPGRPLVQRQAPLRSVRRPMSPQAFRICRGCALPSRNRRSRPRRSEGGRAGQRIRFRVWVVDDREQYCNARAISLRQTAFARSLEESSEISTVDEETLLHHCDPRTPSRRRGPLSPGQEADAVYRHDRQPPEDPPDFRRPPARRNARPSVLAHVHAPLGLEIGSQTVPEIAVSIVAELIAHRNLPMFPRPIAAFQRARGIAAADRSSRGVREGADMLTRRQFGQSALAMMGLAAARSVLPTRVFRRAGRSACLEIH